MRCRFPHGFQRGCLRKFKEKSSKICAELNTTALIQRLVVQIVARSHPSQFLCDAQFNHKAETVMKKSISIGKFVSLHCLEKCIGAKFAAVNKLSKLRGAVYESVKRSL
jgi:hypothetical protein